MTAAGSLDVTTPSAREIRIRREFAAPRELVFAAYTRPELVRRWLLGPPGWSMPVCEIDLREGGTYRYEWRGPDGETMAVGGTYLEVAAPERLVSTELFDDDWTGGEARVTTIWAESGDGTTVTTTILYSSEEARNAARATGMTEGMEAGYRRLEELLAAERA